MHRKKGTGLLVVAFFVAFAIVFVAITFLLFSEDGLLTQERPVDPPVAQAEHPAQADAEKVVLSSPEAVFLLLAVVAAVILAPIAIPVVIYFVIDRVRQRRAGALQLKRLLEDHRYQKALEIMEREPLGAERQVWVVDTRAAARYLGAAFKEAVGYLESQGIPREEARANLRLIRRKFEGEAEEL